MSRSSAKGSRQAAQVPDPAASVPDADGTLKAPWPRIIVLPLTNPVAAADRVRWCVALHRAIIGFIGDGAPAMVTGHYHPGATVPPNRLAIQYIAPGWPAHSATSARPSLALLFPASAASAEVAVLLDALGSLHRLRVDRALEVPLDERDRREIDGRSFWDPVPSGAVRVWETEPAVVPETRPPRRQAWRLSDAPLLSLGFVWRDELAGPGRGPRWYEDLAAAVRDRGAEVLGAWPARLENATPDPAGVLGTGWVHRANPGAPRRPYRARLRLGTLAGERTIVAIGQSRHLGGGLLVPRDTAPGEGHGPDRWPAAASPPNRSLVSE